MTFSLLLQGAVAGKREVEGDGVVQEINHRTFELVLFEPRDSSRLHEGYILERCSPGWCLLALQWPQRCDHFFLGGKELSLVEAEQDFSTLASALHSLQTCSIFAVSLALL